MGSWWIAIGAFAVIEITALIFLVALLKESYEPGLYLSFLFFIASQEMAVMTLLLMVLEVIAIFCFSLSVLLSTTSRQLMRISFFPKGLVQRIHNRNEFLSQRWKENVEKGAGMLKNLPREWVREII